MPLTEKQIKYLQAIKSNGGSHAGNILAKNNSIYVKHLDKFIKEYFDFSNSLEDSLESSVFALNRYKDHVEEYNINKANKKKIFSAQSKFESTIIEEYLCRILKNKFGNDVLQYGPVQAYSSLYFSYSDKSSFKQGVEIKLNVKNQDVGIYKRERLSVNSDKNYSVFIPIVCIECKTYLDKTMYEGSVATANRIKLGNPYCTFIIVTETYDIKEDVDIETSRIDNIYVLRKQRRSEYKKNPNPISADVICSLLDFIRSKLDFRRKSVNELIRTKGYLRQ